MDRKVVALVAALSAAGALAESPSRPDPADPGAKVPPLAYESAFAGYRAGREAEVAPWKKVNEEVSGAGMMGAHGAASAKPAATKPGMPMPSQNEPGPDAKPGESKSPAPRRH